jgi:hypothetical protein
MEENEAHGGQTNPEGIESSSPVLTRSGYAGFKAPKFPPTLQGLNQDRTRGQC